MRIVAWNLGHQTKERAIKRGTIEVLQHLMPDVVTFNEFVDGESRRPLREALSAMGLSHFAVSTRVGTNNQVFVAAKAPLRYGTLSAPTTTDAARSNFLHVIVPKLGCEIVGVRAPAYETKRELSDYWSQLGPIISGNKDRPIIFIGDVNTQPESKSPGAAVLRDLVRLGWQLPDPSGPYSWRDSTGRSSRIDHAICAPMLPFSTAAYCVSLRGKEFVGKGRGSISDHAPLVLDLPWPA